MLKILERALIEQRCAIRLRAPQDGGFIVVAVADNGLPLATGIGETLEEAARDMLTDFGMLVLEEGLCAIA